MDLLSWLFPSSEQAKSSEPKAVIVDEAALPRKVQESFSALKDFEQLFVENKCYSVANIFPKRDSWMQDFRALVVELADDPGSADAKEMARLESEAAKMERSMSDRSVEIPGGLNIFMYGADGKSFLTESVAGMEGICADRVSVVHGGKRVVSLRFKLMDGEEISVLESEMESGGGARSSVAAGDGDSEEGDSGKEEGGDD